MVCRGPVFVRCGRRGEAGEVRPVMVGHGSERRGRWGKARRGNLGQARRGAFGRSRGMAGLARLGRARLVESRSVQVWRGR